ncbi:hypothetical protein HQ865_05595 [Mucilaginibacter mali]|uniref:DUF2281 domain-containing protein n=1 Tax=Mucilaginibacter mali TaxID=2740462 RepID=A0A7D4PSQ2_9SPHI|nr:hypothetical protein [Mucilaginibacter mali]QKJ29248.1 hypothetical protein HQ865_05595 [Mucilaginibacter mali]
MIRTVVKPKDQNLSIRLPEIEDETVTHLISETILAEDWLSPEEDVAWQDL